MTRTDTRPKLFAYPANIYSNRDGHRNTLSCLSASEVTAFCRAQTLPNVRQHFPEVPVVRTSPFHAIAASFYAVASSSARTGSAYGVESSSSIITAETEYDQISLCQKPKRELTVSKSKSDYFGCEMRFIRGRLLVVWIDKFSTVCPAFRHLSAAYRVGLNFGDEITRINNKPVSSFDGQISAVYLYLSSLTDITVEVVDKAILENHLMKFQSHTEHAQGSLKRHSSYLSRIHRAKVSSFGSESVVEESIGLSFSEKGTITRVSEGGLGDKAGLKAGELIASIGGTYTLAVHPRLLVQLFQRAKKYSKTGSIVVAAAPSQLIRELVHHALFIISERNLSCDLNYILNHDWEVSRAAQTQQEQHNKRQYSASGIQLMPVISARRNYTSHPSRHTLNGSLANLQTALEHQRVITNMNSVIDV
ncbi:hypothetical protein SARC_05988 [Sphaeroforma arctica JP610]|uniref:PDZ domain-containing protein n=1 Tax=Sphaeroforma arctica JP610 TaxID=667725 RepID=A0A0L0G0G4_9EUKA|nr:hypothetical protein SARC_05988 [Sphaeroforma arctica JP610]KNC81698.1 hypothetical protein SARC_05988 [Sphaeroforma arctica JP610]|eukprot:XP_014155600.1 hypothetical protein SARC_05988 [Sphaeroforma arctica JP610]